MQQPLLYYFHSFVATKAKQKNVNLVLHLSNGATTSYVMTSSITTLGIAINM